MKSAILCICIGMAVADVSHIPSRRYLPPPPTQSTVTAQYYEAQGKFSVQKPASPKKYSSESQYQSPSFGSQVEYKRQKSPAGVNLQQLYYDNKLLQKQQGQRASLRSQNLRQSYPTAVRQGQDAELQKAYHQAQQQYQQQTQQQYQQQNQQQYQQQNQQQYQQQNEEQEYTYQEEEDTGSKGAYNREDLERLLAHDIPEGSIEQISSPQGYDYDNPKELYHDSEIA